MLNIESDIIVSLPLHNLIAISFLLILGLYAVFSFVLYYHWNEYSVEPTITKLTLILYFVTTIPLMILLGLITLII